MYVEMSCTCEAGFILDTDTDDGWHLVLRFASAHVSCGYMTSGMSDDVLEATPPAPKKRVVKPRRIQEEDEE